MKIEQNVPKHWDIKFRRRGITQKKAYNKFFLPIFKYANPYGKAPLIVNVNLVFFIR